MFENRAGLTVYLERADLDKFAAMALQEEQSAADYARVLILAHIGDNAEKANEGGDSKPVRRVDPVRVDRGSTPAPRRAPRTTEPKPPAESVSQLTFRPDQAAAPDRECKHKYGLKKCPFPTCENYKWKDEK